MRPYQVHILLFNHLMHCFGSLLTVNYFYTQSVFGAANEQAASAFDVDGYPTFFLVRKSATSDTPSAEAYEGDNKMKAMKTWIAAHLAPANDKVLIFPQLHKYMLSYFHTPVFPSLFNHLPHLTDQFEIKLSDCAQIGARFSFFLSLFLSCFLFLSVFLSSLSLFSLSLLSLLSLSLLSFFSFSCSFLM